MTAWTAEDIRVASLLEAELGPIRVIDVIEHKENRMTDTTVSPNLPDGGWADDPDDVAAYQAATYPEVSDNPHNHVYTWSPKLPDGSMLVIRSQTAQGLVEATEAMAPMAGRLRAAWGAIVGTPQAPVNQFPSQTPPPFGPNVSVPQAPGYQGPPVQQQAPQWGAPQQQGGFGGGQQAASRGPKPRPNWPQVYKINVPFAAKDQFKAFRNDNQDALKGKVAWAGGGDYWIEGSVAQGFAQYNPMPA